ncbi:hypothetical protein [Paenibacillus oryzisoli]|uniref:hypothetical protein n=1 Tax=Paenibacillus oryzisoli TaxID=1850517 RepID=UPI0012F79D6C|nr:hypothetical protein [Paenibacillus oryzisoli]
MDGNKFTSELEKAIATVVQAFIKAHGENIEKVNIESYYDRGTIRIKVIEKKKSKVSK